MSLYVIGLLCDSSALPTGLEGGLSIQLTSAAPVTLLISCFSSVLDSSHNMGSLMLGAHIIIIVMVSGLFHFFTYIVISLY